MKYLEEAYGAPTCVVGTCFGLNAAFPYQNGVRQGCPMSPVLFDFYTQISFGVCKMCVPGLKSKIIGLLFADDTVFLPGMEHVLEDLFNKVFGWTKQKEMIINKQK